MRPRSLLFVSLTIAALGAATLPDAAEAATQRSRATPISPAAPRGFDMTLRGPSVAMQAAQAAQAASLPGAAASAAASQAAASVETPTSAPASTVSGLTVSPEIQRRGRVVASSDATSLTSPDFSAADAEAGPLAIAIGPNTAVGRQEVDNRPPATAGGLLGTNPELLGINPTRGQVGVTTVW